MKDFVILPVSNQKYGRYYIPSSDYSLNSIYSSTSRSTCLSKLDSWLYNIYLEAIKVWTEIPIDALEAGDRNKSINSIDWVMMISMIPFHQNESFQLYKDNIELPILINTLITISSDINLKIHDRIFYFPSDCRFICSDLDTFSRIIQDKYSLLLLDPPWPNRSVSRSNPYKTLDIYSLFNLKLNKITKYGSIVAIWVSNNPKYQKFIKEKFFPNYNIKLIEEWYWIKVTRLGNLVVSFSDLSHRKPFEVLYIGKITNQTQRTVKKKVLLSVPSKYHSRKPFIHGIKFINFINCRFIVNAFRMQ